MDSATASSSPGGDSKDANRSSRGGLSGLLDKLSAVHENIGAIHRADSLGFSQASTSVRGRTPIPQQVFATPTPATPLRPNSATPTRQPPNPFLALSGSIPAESVDSLSDGDSFSSEPRCRQETVAMVAAEVMPVVPVPAAPPPPSVDPPISEYPVGTKIIAKSLVSDSHINGMQGVVTASRTDGRAAVDFGPATGKRALLPKNMQLLPSVKSAPPQLQSVPEFEYIHDDDEVQVVAPPPPPVVDPPISEYPVGTKIIAKNLVSDSHINGMQGVVTASRTDGRAAVDFGPATGKRALLPKNMQLSQPTTNPPLKSMPEFEYIHDDDDSEIQVVAPPPPLDPPISEYPVGAKIIAKNLVSDPHINGMQGVVTASRTDGRAAVDFGPAIGKRALLPKNMQLCNPAQRNLSAAPSAFTSTTEYEEDDETTTTTTTTTTRNIPPTTPTSPLIRPARFQVSKTVEAVGLVGDPHINSKRGVITSVSRSDGRIAVDFGPPFGRRALQKKNLRLLEADIAVHLLWASVAGHLRGAFHIGKAKTLLGKNTSLRERRYWVTDVFSQAICRPSNVAGVRDAVSLVHDPLTKRHCCENVLRIEKDPHDTKRLVLRMKGSSSAQELYFQSGQARQRFAEVVMVMRNEAVWCPYLHSLAPPHAPSPCFIGLHGRAAVPFEPVENTTAFTEVASPMLDAEVPSDKTQPTHTVSGEARVKVAREPYLDGTIRTVSLNVECKTAAQMGHIDVKDLVFGTSEPTNTDVVVIGLTNTIRPETAEAEEEVQSYTSLLREQMRGLGYGLLMTTEAFEDGAEARKGFAPGGSPRSGDGENSPGNQTDSFGENDSFASSLNVPRRRNAMQRISASLRTQTAKGLAIARKNLSLQRSPAAAAPTSVLQLYVRPQQAALITNHSIWTGSHTKTYSERRLLASKKDISLATNIVSVGFNYRETSFSFLCTSLLHINVETQRILTRIAEHPTAGRYDTAGVLDLSFLYHRDGVKNFCEEAGWGSSSGDDARQPEAVIGERTTTLRALLNEAETGYAEGDILHRFDNTVLLGGIGLGFGAGPSAYTHATSGSWEGGSTRLSALRVEDPSIDRLGSEMREGNVLPTFREPDLVLTKAKNGAASLENRILTCRGLNDFEAESNGEVEGRPGLVSEGYASFEASGGLGAGVRAVLKVRTRLVFAAAFSPPAPARSFVLDRLRVVSVPKTTLQRHAEYGMVDPYFASQGAYEDGVVSSTIHPTVLSKHYLSAWANFSDTPATRGPELKVEKGGAALQCGSLPTLACLTDSDSYLREQDLVVSLRESSASNSALPIPATSSINEDTPGPNSDPILGSFALPLRPVLNACGGGVDVSSTAQIFFRKPLTRGGHFVHSLLESKVTEGVRGVLKKSGGLEGGLFEEAEGSVVAVEGWLRVSADEAAVRIAAQRDLARWQRLAAELSEGEDAARASIRATWRTAFETWSGFLESLHSRLAEDLKAREFIAKQILPDISNSEEKKRDVIINQENFARNSVRHSHYIALCIGDEISARSRVVDAANHAFLNNPHFAGQRLRAVVIRDEIALRSAVEVQEGDVRESLQHSMEEGIEDILHAAQLRAEADIAAQRSLCVLELARRNTLHATEDESRDVLLTSLQIGVEDIISAAEARIRLLRRQATVREEFCTSESLSRRGVLEHRISDLSDKLAPLFHEGLHRIHCTAELLELCAVEETLREQREGEAESSWSTLVGSEQAGWRLVARRFAGGGGGGGGSTRTPQSTKGVRRPNLVPVSLEVGGGGGGGDGGLAAQNQGKKQSIPLPQKEVPENPENAASTPEVEAVLSTSHRSVCVSPTACPVSPPLPEREGKPPLSEGVLNILVAADQALQRVELLGVLDGSNDNNSTRRSEELQHTELESGSEHKTILTPPQLDAKAVERLYTLVTEQRIELERLKAEVRSKRTSSKRKHSTSSAEQSSSLPTSSPHSNEFHTSPSPSPRRDSEHNGRQEDIEEREAQDTRFWESIALRTMRHSPRKVGKRVTPVRGVCVFY